MRCCQFWVCRSISRCTCHTIVRWKNIQTFSQGANTKGHKLLRFLFSFFGIAGLFRTFLFLQYQCTKTFCCYYWIFQRHQQLILDGRKLRLKNADWQICLIDNEHLIKTFWSLTWNIYFMHFKPMKSRTLQDKYNKNWLIQSWGCGPKFCNLYAGPSWEVCKYCNTPFCMKTALYVYAFLLKSIPQSGTTMCFVRNNFLCGSQCLYC